MQKIARILYPILTVVLVIVVGFLTYALANQGQSPRAVLRPTKTVALRLDSLLRETWFVWGEEADDTIMMQPYLELIKGLEKGNDPFATTALAKKILPGLQDSTDNFQAKLPTEQITTALLDRMLFLQDSITSQDVSGQLEVRSFPLSTRVKQGEPFRMLISAYHPKQSNTWLNNPEFRPQDELLPDGASFAGEGKLMFFRSRVTKSVRSSDDTLRVEYDQEVRRPLPGGAIKTDTVTTRYFITR